MRQAAMNPASPQPKVSVVILNYNGRPWIERCLASLQAQTSFQQCEVIVADNHSPDGSDLLAEQILKTWANGRFIQHGENWGYCEGNNRAATHARGQYLFFLNNDTWLEPDCLEKLLAGAESVAATAATPLVLNYDDDSFQSSGAEGFDLFGLPSTRRPQSAIRDILMPEGCSYLIKREVFEHLGGFDRELFMYADELDLSWRVWITGGKAVIVPQARLHHRGAAQVNPAGGDRTLEFRTSDTKRFYANRNCLLVLLKNAAHLLLVLVPLQLLLLAIEACASLLLVRRWSFVRRAYLEAVKDCWRLRQHLRAERRRLRTLRQRTDWGMLRFLRWRPNRWDEVLRMAHRGLPRASRK